MDTRNRHLLIRQLHAEMERSVGEAMRYSSAWQRRSANLRRQHGDDSHELVIFKRDDLRLKEYMASYVWHRDNSTFCATIIGLLMNEAVNSIVTPELPRQRA